MSRLLREAEVRQLTGLCRVTRWRLEREGKFPKRVILTGRSVGWREDEVREWIDTRGRATAATSDAR